MARWIKTEEFPPLATCSITELGFVRVLSQATVYGFTVAEARSALLRLKRSKALPFAFIPDAHDISHLPAWAKTSKQTTDGHLAQLAEAHGACWQLWIRRFGARISFLRPISLRHTKLAGHVK